MLITDKRRFRSVGFGEDEVPDDAEARGFPRLHKDVHAVPAVEAYRQAVVFEHAEHLLAGRQHPLVVYVARDRTTGAVFKADKVWGVGQNEVDAVIRKADHDLYAIATHESGHSYAPQCQGAPLWCRDHHKDGRKAEQAGADAQAARAAEAD